VNYLLDTNFIIGLLRGSEPYWVYLESLLGQGVPSVSTITRAEIYAGCHPTEESDTSALLQQFDPIPVDASVGDLAGRYVYQFARRGITLHLEDTLIGATAVCEGLILITQNINHFPMLHASRNLIRFPSA
jgi:predicted nucleic acid-binding protein